MSLYKIIRRKYQWLSLRVNNLWNTFKVSNIKSDIQKYEGEIFFGFWKDILQKCKIENRPIYALAPMADVTDVAFRYMLNKYGKPDVTWTEFVSANGLASPGREALKKDLEFDESERPIVAQLFTSEPAKMREAARLCLDLGFDGIDINMGCPDRTIEKQGAGAKMITTPEIAIEVIKAAQEGATLKNEKDEIVKQIPVSVKTRLGFNRIEYVEWLPQILSVGLPTLTVHLRTRKEMSLVPAHYELINEVNDLVKNISPETILLINGDVKSMEHGLELYSKYRLDGVMIGRAIFGKPWFFSSKQLNIGNVVERSLEEKLRIMIEHTKLFDLRLGEVKSFAIMKKHFKAYINGFSGAKELRESLYNCNDSNEVEEVVNKYLESNKLND